MQYNIYAVMLNIHAERIIVKEGGKMTGRQQARPKCSGIQVVRADSMGRSSSAASGKGYTKYSKYFIAIYHVNTTLHHMKAVSIETVFRFFLLFSLSNSIKQRNIKIN